MATAAFWNGNSEIPRGRRRSRSSSTPNTNLDLLNENGIRPRKTKATQNQQYTRWLVQFVGFFILAVLVSVLVGWMQERTGYQQPHSLSGFLMFALLFSALGTLILNIGIKVLMPKSGAGPAFFVMI